MPSSGGSFDHVERALSFSLFARALRRLDSRVERAAAPERMLAQGSQPATENGKKEATEVRSPFLLRTIPPPWPYRALNRPGPSSPKPA